MTLGISGAPVLTTLPQVTLAKSAQWGIVALKRTFDPRLELGSGHRLATDTAGEALALQAAASRHVLPLLGVVQQVRLLCVRNQRRGLTAVSECSCGRHLPMRRAMSKCWSLSTVPQTWRGCLYTPTGRCLHI